MRPDGSWGGRGEERGQNWKWQNPDAKHCHSEGSVLEGTEPVGQQSQQSLSQCVSSPAFRS